VRELATSIKLLTFLSTNTIPEKGRREVLRRLKKGERIGAHRAKVIVDKHRPKPAAR
jgi:hypothetical protein